MSKKSGVLITAWVSFSIRSRHFSISSSSSASWAFNENTLCDCTLKTSVTYFVKPTRPRHTMYEWAIYRKRRLNSQAPCERKYVRYVKYCLCLHLPAIMNSGVCHQKTMENVWTCSSNKRRRRSNPLSDGNWSRPFFTHGYITDFSNSAHNRFY